MKVKTLVVAASACLMMGQAIADNYGSQRSQQESQQWEQKWEQNSQRSHKANRANKEFERTIDANYNQNERDQIHPMFRTRMGDH